MFHRYAILNEAWRLVADGVLNAKDVDAVMSEGLGMRYAFLGAFEAAHLNSEGTYNNQNKQIYTSKMYSSFRYEKVLRGI